MEEPDTENRKEVPAQWSALARLAVGLLGVAGVLIGLGAAWRSESPAAALVVGFGLIALALLANRDLEELSGRWKDVEFKYKRAASDRLDDISERLLVALGADESRELDAGQRLDALRDDVGEVATLAREEAKRIRKGDPEGWASEVGERIRDGQLQLLRHERPSPDYMVVAHDPEKKRIVAYLRWWGDWHVFCEVRSPDGGVATHLAYGSRHMSGNNFTVMYPSDFDGAPKLAPADYEFSWRRAMRAGGIGRAEDDWAPGYVLARDFVTVSEESLSSGGTAEVRRAEVTSEWEQMMGSPASGRVQEA